MGFTEIERLDRLTSTERRDWSLACQHQLVIARVTSEGFHLLDAAPIRINAKDTPIPYHPNLWSAHRPSAQNIVAKARKLLRE